MHLFEFEVFTNSGSVRYAQWGADADEAFDLLSAIRPDCLDGFEPAFFEVLFQVVGSYEGAFVYWLEAGEA